jgi:hypothetical protein
LVQSPVACDAAQAHNVRTWPIKETQVLTSVVTATLFRLSFFVGGTDFPGYFNQRSGIVVASAIEKYSYIAVNYLERLLEKRFRISYSRLKNTDVVEEIRHDIAHGGPPGRLTRTGNCRASP